MEIYLFITLISVGLLGVRLYQLGSVWSEEFMEDKELSKRINNILLVLFYLFNAGLVMVSVIIWDNDSPQAIYGLSRVGLAFT
ncbi:MAG: hypothetical protein NWP83_06010, partial [Spirosomaceae bacterium]|nr:hypothetical protein [Spirosomataceae bacterium]